ncbi:sugar phosphate isomerase/epimerase family protein [Paenibacillus sp. DMB20]|uniref:sugar phosphate isomerase/epimerase family protein n=1 Tax=Paenibacillus sp. DMB20 TaxID=1642570 RepID=UPI000627CB24|nr:sugar phosphate isomerase/epimerase [Paenibacillus sp. DMB20]KKO51265.1 xylose isomerase [Paenibacillus sp. DMB20]
MKFSVFTVATPDMTPEELAAFAKEAGIEGIEWRFKEIPADAREEEPSYWRHNRCSMDPAGTEEEWLRFERAARENGRKSIAVVPYLTCGDIAGTRNVMKAAKLLGASFIRAGVPAYDRRTNYRGLYEQAVRYLREVEELAAEFGIKALVETHHNTIAPSAGLAHRLVCHFDPRFIGVLYDPGNMVYEGYENYRMGLELLGPYLAHVHVKNAGYSRAASEDGSRTIWNREWLPLEQGAVSWPEVLSDLKSVGYGGYFGIEDFSGSASSREMLKTFVSRMAEWGK